MQDTLGPDGPVALRCGITLLIYKQNTYSVFVGKPYAPPVSGTDSRSARVGAMLGRPVNAAATWFFYFLCVFSYGFFVFLFSSGFSFPFLFFIFFLS
jgi:hypothetical protein